MSDDVEPIPVIRSRETEPTVYQQAVSDGYAPLAARIIAGRLSQAAAIGTIVHPALSAIAPPSRLLGMHEAVERICHAVRGQEKIGILTDYDVDGVTSHAVMYRAFCVYFGYPETHLVSLIGHRLNDGYGVSDALVDRILALTERPTLILTADCGSSDEARMARLKAAGIDVIITDHHAIPVEGAPSSAYAVINPAQADCDYPDVTIAGCMVAWLLMSQLRTGLIQQQLIAANVPKLAAELDWVALGTVADCVSMGTPINRAVVKIGLQIMNRLERSCWRVLSKQLGKEGKAFNAEDLGFQIGPRINARSRMSDPFAALYFVLSKDDKSAADYFTILDHDNQSRKAVEREMVDNARVIARQQLQQGVYMLVVYLADGHSGVQGIVAARLMQWSGCPALVLCPHKEAGQLTGSARSIPEIHIRDALQQVADQAPNLLAKFGGHKGAAGLTVSHQDLTQLQTLLNEVVGEMLNQKNPNPVIWTDGELDENALHKGTYTALQAFEPWGREFEKPIFQGLFYVEQAKAVGQPAVHLSLRLSTEQSQYKAIWFRALASEEQAPPIAVGDVVNCAYALALDDFRGDEQIQLIVEYASVDE